MLSGKDAAPTTAGLLADALNSLAAGLADMPTRARQDLRLRLLITFTDVGYRVGAGSSSAADLGELLPAVAVAAEGLQPRTLRLLGGSSSRMSMHEIQVRSTGVWMRLVWSLTDAKWVYSHDLGTLPVAVSVGLSCWWHDSERPLSTNDAIRHVSCKCWKLAEHVGTCLLPDIIADA